MKEEEVRKLLRRRESETLEFARKLPPRTQLARLITSFANTSGGALVVGVEESGEVVGLKSLKNISDRLNAALAWITPNARADALITEVDGKKILIVEVPPSRVGPHYSQAGAFMRRGSNVTPLTSEAIYDAVYTRSSDDARLREEVMSLARVIEDLNEQLVRSRSWRTRSQDYLLGAVVAIVLSLIVSALTGL